MIARHHAAEAVLTTLIGGILGVAVGPANKAASLSPIDAVRHE